jgi:hypothetical protein
MRCRPLRKTHPAPVGMTVPPSRKTRRCWPRTFCPRDSINPLESQLNWTSARGVTKG